MPDNAIDGGDQDIQLFIGCGLRVAQFAKIIKEFFVRPAQFLDRINACSANGD